MVGFQGKLEKVRYDGSDLSPGKALDRDRRWQYVKRESFSENGFVTIKDILSVYNQDVSGCFRHLPVTRETYKVSMYCI